MAERLRFTSRPRQSFVIEIDGAEFAIARRVPGITFMEFITSFREVQERGDDSDMVALGGMAAQVREMFEAVMEPEEFQRFWKWARSPDGPEFDVIVEVLSSLVAQDTDRPTKRPGRS